MKNKIDLKKLLGLGDACPLCSSENWKIYHTPGNPCPKRKHLFTNGVETIVAMNPEDAARVVCEFIGEELEDYLKNYDSIFKQIDDEKLITINFECYLTDYPAEAVIEYPFGKFDQFVRVKTLAKHWVDWVEVSRDPMAQVYLSSTEY